MSDTPIFDNVKTPTPIGDKVAADQQAATNIARACLTVTQTASAEIKLPAWAPYAKAIVAGLISFLLAFLSALLPFLENGHVVSVVGWVTAGIAGLVALSASAGIVYAVPNAVKQ